MDFNIDTSYILYSTGAVFGIISLFYFGFDLILGLSPLTKSLLLLSGSVVFFSIGNHTDGKISGSMSYIFSVVSYIVLASYFISSFQLGSNTIFLALALSSGLFIGLGHIVSKGLKLDRNRVKYILLGAFVFGLALTITDLAAPEPTYNLDLKETYSQDEGSIGNLTVENTFYLPRTIERRNYNACVYTPDKIRAGISQNNYGSDLIYKEARETGLELEIELRRQHGEGENSNQTIENYPVELAQECPESSETEKIVLVERLYD